MSDLLTSPQRNRMQVELTVARRHGIGTGQLYQWRQQSLGTGRVKAAGFARGEVVDEPVPPERPGRCLVQ
jgi:transposase-like protein